MFEIDDNVFIAIIIILTTLLVLFLGEPDIHDGLVQWFNNL